MQDRGYHTMMVTCNNLSKDPLFGFEDVFIRFDAVNPYHFKFPSFQSFIGFKFLKYFLRFTRIFKVLVFSPEHSMTYFDAPRLNKTVIRELLRKDDRPFFLYVHYMEPHAPYYMHPYRPFQINFYLPTHREKIFANYQSEIQAVDQAIAELFTHLHDNGLLTNTYVLITADHGEEFYDHGHWGHGKNLFPEVLHVPAILVMPPAKKKTQKIKAVVENIDIPATIAELANQDIPGSWEGHSVLQLLDENANKEKAKNGDEIKDNQKVAFSQFDNGYVFQASVVNDEWQVILQDEQEKQQVMLFNLAEDSGARRNLAGQGHEKETMMVKLLKETLQRLQASATQFQGEVEVIDQEQLEQMRTLGYID